MRIRRGLCIADRMFEEGTRRIQGREMRLDELGLVGVWKDVSETLGGHIFGSLCLINSY